MQIITLGTSSGTPTKQRNVSATAIKFKAKKSWCLVDCGEGTQHQLLQTKLSLRHLSLIAITHVHGDHCYGLPGLVASAAMSGRTEAMTIIGPQAVLDWLLQTRDMSQSRSHFELECIAIESWQQPVHHAGFEVAIHPLSHRVPSHAYQFTEARPPAGLDTQKLSSDGVPKGPMWGQIKQGHDLVLADGRTIKAKDYGLPARPARSVIIAGDNDDPQLLSPAMAGVNAVFHEATHTEAVKQKVGPWPQHSSAKQVAHWAQSVSLPHLVLTHFSPRYATVNRGIPEIQEEAGQPLPRHLVFGQ